MPLWRDYHLWPYTYRPAEIGVEVAERPPRQEAPADVIGAAVKTMRILTGEETEELDSPLSPGQQLGKLGGAARAKAMTSDRRAEIPKKAAATRWGTKIRR